MADINVERKQRSIWPWLLGLIALALLVWLLASMFDRGGDEQPTTQTTTESTTTTTAPAGSGT